MAKLKDTYVFGNLYLTGNLTTREGQLNWDDIVQIIQDTNSARDNAQTAANNANASVNSANEAADNANAAANHANDTVEEEVNNMQDKITNSLNSLEKDLEDKFAALANNINVNAQITAYLSSFNAVQIGSGANAISSYDIAIGQFATARYTSVAIGRGATASGMTGENSLNIKASGAEIAMQPYTSLTLEQWCRVLVDSSGMSIKVDNEDYRKVPTATYNSSTKTLDITLAT